MCVTRMYPWLLELLKCVAWSRSVYASWAHNLRLQEDPEFEQICKEFERDHEDLYKIFVRPFLTPKV